MKCPKCEGCGKLLKKEKGKACYEVSLSFCDLCHGSGEIEVTNEEWLCSIPTEEKADLLFGTFYLAGRNDEKNGVWKGVDTIMEWLKQPHKE